MRGEGGVKWGGWFEQYERFGAQGLGRFGCTDNFDGDVGERKVGRLKRLYSQLRIQGGGRNLCKLQVVWGRRSDECGNREDVVRELLIIVMKRTFEKKHKT